jgi:hypothetical protein
VAIFNISETSETLRYEWKDLGFARKTYKLRDLWDHKNLGAADSLTLTLPGHGSALYRLSAVR